MKWAKISVISLICGAGLVFSSSLILAAQLPNNVPVSSSTAGHSITILRVPFTPQAPYAKWDAIHEEACEEAAMLMAAEYYKGNKTLLLSPKLADQAILQLVEWETKNNYGESITASEVVKVLKDYYGLNGQVQPFDSVKIKQAVKDKKVVLLPTAGRELKNPYFRRPGPVYHMLLVRGFEGNEFIVNDPGTKRGENYRYTTKILSQAVHDWNDGKVSKGKQLMIIVSKSK